MSERAEGRLSQQADEQVAGESGEQVVRESGEPAALDAAGVHRLLVELVSAGRRAEALALIGPDAVDHRGGTSGDHVGRAAWADKWEHMYDGLAEVSMIIEQNVASGDTSANRYTLRGTHAASGRSYQITGIDMIRVRNGKLVEHWALLDSAAMRHQLGPDE
ncbi:MAG TPA: ester cyclase [Streptosporangiaceae bacterium]